MTAVLRAGAASRVRRHLRLAVVLGLVAGTVAGTGCLGWGDLDPFGLTERRIVGPYRLKAWEDDSTFYLFASRDGTAPGFGQPVERIGWDRRHVVALRAGDGATPDGWAVIDVSTGRTRYLPRTGGLAADSAVARLATYPAREAWARLGAR